MVLSSVRILQLEAGSRVDGRLLAAFGVLAGDGQIQTSAAGGGAKPNPKGGALPAIRARCTRQTDFH
jgi:hypothetical protein